MKEKGSTTAATRSISLTGCFERYVLPNVALFIHEAYILNRSVEACYLETLRIAQRRCLRCTR